MRRVTFTLGVALALVVWHPMPSRRDASGQSLVQALTVAPTTTTALREWDNTVNRMLRTSELQVRMERDDTLLPGRTHQQMDQYYRGVRVWGASVSRQLEGATAISVFGVLYSDPAIDVTPQVSRAAAKAMVEQIGGTELGPERQPELVILPDEAVFRLVWVGEIATFSDHLRIFIDAMTGRVVRQENILQTQLPSDAYVGHGRGVLGDDKKISTYAFGSGFLAFDTIRPPDISTYDLRSGLNRTILFLNGVLSPTTSDYASAPSSNDWADPATVDAHVYSSYTYDYFFKRFGRRGLDNADRRIWNIVHPVSRADIFTASAAVFNTYYTNAFYSSPSGLMVYGEGMPSNLFVAARAFSASL